MEELATKVIGVSFAVGMLFVGLVAVSIERDRTDVSGTEEVEAFITAMSEVGFELLVGIIILIGGLILLVYVLRKLGGMS